MSLLNASMKNGLTDPNDMLAIKNVLQGDYKLNIGTTQLNDEAKITLNKLLSETEKKRACCMGQKSIDVRIPLPNGIISDNSDTGLLMAKYGYYDQRVDNIPIDQPGFCTFDNKDFTKNSANCDDFYNLYCKNIVNEFTKANNGKFDPAIFSTSYKSECSCFMPIPKWVTEAYQGEPMGQCVLPNCGPNKAVYLDRASRTGPCNNTICYQNVKIDSATLAENASIATTLQNNCIEKTGVSPITVTKQPVEPTITNQPSGQMNSTGGPMSSTGGPVNNLNNVPGSVSPNIPISAEIPKAENVQISSQTSSIITGFSSLVILFCFILFIVLIWFFFFKK
ncbi:MAG: hypothetical protein Barrevirus3_10 [Barrevirus sp.]|uniref:Uncharacterized protein n=1 Tax=Barrevirus sp. TaxID=2487763 RepID=A0A3G4ZPR4_9VIRU|nr:MAG: hypothetical protein Barrevirus3_10 [Barrevirus sp.]